MSKINYKNEDYKLFYESLLYVCEFEHKIYSKLNDVQRYNLDR